MATEQDRQEALAKVDRIVSSLSPAERLDILHAAMIMTKISGTPFAIGMLAIVAMAQADDRIADAKEAGNG